MKVIFNSEILELCLRQSYTNLQIPHITGLEVIQLATENNYKGIILTKIQNIQYSVFIHRDFAPPKHDNNEREYYLVNTDTDLFRWINSKGELLQMDKDSYVGWEIEVDS
nr:hypothetical protein [Mammaliicoccus vitulinus]